MTENSGRSMNNRRAGGYRKLILIIAILMIASTHALAQDDDPLITNEYRFTQLVTKPVNKKLVLFTYSGYTRSPEKQLHSVYGSPPNLVYIPKSWIEIYAAFILVFTSNKTGGNSWEFRPITGVKFYLPNSKKLNIFSWTRYEDRFILQNNNLKSIPRIRNRFGIEAPLARMDKAWTPKTFYMLADIEPIWRLDEKRLQVLRLRGGLGYIYSKRIRAEFQYFGELSETSSSPLDHTGNIFRLNIKILLPKKGLRYPKDADID
jgi:hypothetical protein